MRTKKILCLLFAVVMLFSTITFTAYANEQKGDTDITELEQLGVAQGPALNAFFQAKKLIAASGDDKATHPEGYGGAYINDENELVFQIKSGYGDLSAKLADVIDDDLPVEYNTCQYSLNDLTDMCDEILRSPGEKLEANVFFDIENNSADIELVNGEKNIKDEMQSYIESNSLPFSVEIVDEPDATSDAAAHTSNNKLTSTSNTVTATSSTITLTGGSTLYYLASGSYFSLGSLGFSGTYNNTTAYITAGNVAEVQNYLSSDATVNSAITCDEGITPVVGDDGDYGIVTVTSNSSSYTIAKSRYVKTGSSSTGSVTYYYYVSNELPTGTCIYKYGHATGLTVGKYIYGIKSYYNYDTAVSVGNVYSFGQLTDSATQVLNNHGDSGGPVWFVYKNGVYTYRTLLGVISGKTDINSQDPQQGTLYVYYMSIEDIIDDGFTPYSISLLDEYLEQDDVYYIDDDGNFQD